MANPGLSEIVTTTLRNRSRQLSDQVMKHNALLNRINENGNKRPFTGRSIQLELEYAENATVSMYTNYDTINTTPQDVLTSAEFDIKQIAGTVTMSGLEAIKNSGQEAVIDLLESRIANLEKSMMNTLASQIFGAGTNATDFDGLQKLVADDPTTGTVGGINRANFSFWRNKVYDFSVQGVTASASTIQTAMKTIYLDLVRNNDAPDMIVGGKDYFSFYWNSLQSIQRVMNNDEADAGYMSLMYLGSPVFYDVNARDASMYFLNTDYLQLRYHPDRDFAPLEPRDSFNADSMVFPQVWAGNLVCSNCSLQGVICA